MSPFDVGTEHKFTFGLRTIDLEPWEFVYRLADIGTWGVSVTDDVLVPAGSSAAERHDILDKFAKALDSTGMVVSTAIADLAGHPVFNRGAFTSVDRDVRRYAIQKTMRAIDLGAELGALVHALAGGRDGFDSVAAMRPLDSLGRFREAVDFLCGYVRDQRYPTRFVLESTLNERPGTSLLPTIGHALAFIDTLEHPDMVGLSPEVAHGTPAGPSGYRGVAQAIDAGKLFHIDLNGQQDGRHDQDPIFGSTSPTDAFFLVKLLEESGYDGPLYFDVDRNAAGDDGIWNYVLGCLHTYRALAAKVQRFADDPEIGDALADCGALELAEPSVGPFTVEAGLALSTELIDPQALVQRTYRNQRLDQLVLDLVLGLR